MSKDKTEALAASIDCDVVTDRTTGAAVAAPAGKLLAHNQVTPASATKQGIWGFRFFAVEPSAEWAPCDCGWRPDLGVHYSHPKKDAP